MMKRLGLLGACAAMAIATPAWAAKTFQLNNVTLQGNGTLTGTFTANDALTQLIAVSITASENIYNPGNGINYHFEEFTYSYDSATDSPIYYDGLPWGFEFQVAKPGADTLVLKLWFDQPLSDSGATTLSTNSSYERQTGLARYVTNGNVSIAAAAVPEPATWLMMIGGFGLIGFAMRRRRRVRASVSFG